MRFVFAITLVLASIVACATTAAAQGVGVNPTGTYDVEWIEVQFTIRVDFGTASGVVTVTALNPTDPEADPSWTLSGDGVPESPCYVWSNGIVQCGSTVGTLNWWDQLWPDGTLDTLWFDMDVWGGGHNRFHTVMAGAKRAARSPAVTITAPTAGQMVVGTTPVRIQTQGFTGARSYTLLVDGVQRQFGTTSSDSFTLWFNTTRVANAAHAFTVRVTQSGQTVSSQALQVTVQNP